MFWIRKDWLDAVGLPLPETREEFYQALVAFKEQDPGGLGDDLVVMGMTSSKWGDQYSNLMTSFLDPRVVNSDRERAGYGWRLYTANVLSTAPGYVEGLRFMNKLHPEGMFHPDWMLETPEISGGKQFVAQLVSGRMGVFSHGYSGIFFYGWAEQIKEQSPHAEWWPIDPFENAEGRYVKQTYTPTAIQNFVPATSSDESAANAIKYLNFLSLRDTRLFFSFGEMMDVGGAPPESRYYDKALLGNIDNRAEYWIKSRSQLFPEYEEQIALELELSIRDGLPEIKTDGVSETEAQMQETIRLKQAEWNVRIITAAPEDVDRLYAQAVEELNELGAGKIYEEKTALYDKTYGK